MTISLFNEKKRNNEGKKKEEWRLGREEVRREKKKGASGW